MNFSLGEGANDDDDDNTFEDQINRTIENHRLLDNASYFAFTATPKNKTLELFGDPAPQPDGTTKHLPFHAYTMKQAIQEGFILDVLGNHTTIDSYFNLVKKVDDDPEFDSKRASASCGSTLKDMNTPSQPKQKSWWTTSTSPCSCPIRSTAEPGLWW